MSSERPDDDATVIRPAGGAAVPPSRAATADGGNALPVGTYLGEFEITSVLGEGGFGIVYLAWDHTLDRRVALKEYMPSALAARGANSQVLVKSERHRDTFNAGLKSFVNEAKLLAQFDHPSLVKVYRFWEASGTAFMVMPFVEGQTLKEALRERGEPPDEAWLMALLAPLTQALGVLHRERCYHRDIAPDNILLLAGSQRPLLLDFGAARRVIGDMTHALTVILKPGYAPVEQYAEVPSMKQGPWTDVYALAAVVYYAITGRTPPPSVGRMVSDSYEPLATAAAGRYSDRLLSAIDRALRVKPDERTASMDDLRADLGLEPVRAESQETMPAAIGGFGAATPATQARSTPNRPSDDRTAPPAVAPTREPGPAGRKTALGPLIGGAAVLAVMGAAAVWWLKAPEKAPPPVVVAAAPAPAPTAQAPASQPSPAAAAAAPAPAPPPAPAAAVLPAPGDIPAAFAHVVASQTPGFDVQATSDKASLKIDRDRLAFSVSSSRDGFVYVLLHGPDGSLMLLYPNRKVRDNRIKAGQTLKLPQASWPLVTGEPPGPERFLAIVTADKRDHQALAASTESFYGFLMLPAAAPAGTAGADDASWLLGRPSCGRADCSADYGAAGFTIDVVR
jgi:serine/threonine protein kinase